jgi:hypothetical protein
LHLKLQRQSNDHQARPGHLGLKLIGPEFISPASRQAAEASRALRGHFLHSL